MAEKTKYIVTKKHTLGYKVGEVVELNDAMAKALQGKVVLQSEHTTPAEEAKAITSLKADLDKASKINDELTVKIEALTKENAELKKAAK